MPRNGRIKPVIKQNKVTEYIIGIKNKRYSIVLCDNCANSVYNYFDSKRDRSRYNNYKYGSNNRTPEMYLSNRDGYFWKYSDSMNPLIKFLKSIKNGDKCDFCTGKYNLEFFK